jgi:hypothetical protein
MMRALLAVLIFVSGAAHAKCLFVNLNNASEEINYCKRGLEEKAVRTGQDVEDLIVVDGVEGDTPDTKKRTHSNTYWQLRKVIAEKLRNGERLDCIVISGEDGSGHFFGTNAAGQSTNFYSADLRQLYDDFPQLKGTLNSAALWGCYPTSVHGAEQFWVNRIPAMQFTMGFTIQGPSKERGANHDLLRQFCDRREEGAQATSMDALCQFYDSLQQITHTSLGICNRTGLASKEYGHPGTDERCFTYDQLKDRCSEFLQNYDALEATYEDYKQGKREDFEFDKNGNLSDLRKFYNQVQLWRHCQDKFKTERGYDMPYAPDIIRLVKFNKLLSNLKKMNGPELQQYDIMLKNMGLKDFRLGDLATAHRSDLIAKLEGVIGALEKLAGGANSVTIETQVAKTAPAKAPEPEATVDISNGFLFGGGDTSQGADTAAPAPVTSTQTVQATVTKSAGLVNGIDPARALRMAQCLRQTLVNTDYRCAPFSMVSEHPSGPSLCVISYERAAQRFEDDPC